MMASRSDCLFLLSPRNDAKIWSNKPRAKGEEAKIALRNHRREANDMLKDAEKEKEISQDDLKRALEKVQGKIDQFIKDIEDLLTKKEKEILEV